MNTQFAIRHTPEAGSIQPKKTISAAGVWNIQRQKKSRVQRRATL